MYFSIINRGKIMKYLRLNQITKIVTCILILLLMFCNVTFAARGRSDLQDDSDLGQSTHQTELEEGEFSGWQDQADDFFSRADETDSGISVAKAIEIFLPVGRVLVGIATIVLVVVGLIMGVKYMMSGSNEKAQLKQKLIYYVISIVLVYGAVGIFSLIVSIMNNITQ